MDSLLEQDAVGAGCRFDSGTTLLFSLPQPPTLSSYTFISVWAEDAEYYEHPATLLAKGVQEIRDRHVIRFGEAHLHGKLINRVVIGNKVIDYEIVTRDFSEGLGSVEVVAIYEVVDGKIAKAWFIMGNKTLD